MSTSKSTGDENRARCCFEAWTKTQKTDLSELLQALKTTPITPNQEQQFTQLIKKNIQHFEEYMNRRTFLARHDAFAFFAPSWCTSFENSNLWIGGCRPSLFFRLLYALCSLEIEPRLADFLNGITTCSEVGGDLTSGQLCRVNILHIKTVSEEVKMTSKWASLQENTADGPFAVIANEPSNCDGTCVDNKEVDAMMDKQQKAMARIMEEADQLRMRTLKELVLDILTPLQGVVFLAAGKKLNLCIHQWGKKRDHLHGRD